MALEKPKPQMLTGLLDMWNNQVFSDRCLVIRVASKSWFAAAAASSSGVDAAPLSKKRPRPSDEEEELPQSKRQKTSDSCTAVQSLDESEHDDSKLEPPKPDTTIAAMDIDSQAAGSKQAKLVAEKSVWVSSALVAAGSRKLRALLSAPMAERDSKQVMLDVSSLEHAQILCDLLELMYSSDFTGFLARKKWSGKQHWQAILLADEYLMEQLLDNLLLHAAMNLEKKQDESKDSTWKDFARAIIADMDVIQISDVIQCKLRPVLQRIARCRFANDNCLPTFPDWSAPELELLLENDVIGKQDENDLFMTVMNWLTSFANDLRLKRTVTQLCRPGPEHQGQQDQQEDISPLISKTALKLLSLIRFPMMSEGFLHDFPNSYDWHGMDLPQVPEWISHALLFVRAQTRKGRADAKKMGETVLFHPTGTKPPVHLLHGSLPKDSWKDKWERPVRPLAVTWEAMDKMRPTEKIYTVRNREFSTSLKAVTTLSFPVPISRSAGAEEDHQISTAVSMNFSGYSHRLMLTKHRCKRSHGCSTDSKDPSLQLRISFQDMWHDCPSAAWCATFRYRIAMFSTRVDDWVFLKDPMTECMNPARCKVDYCGLKPWSALEDPGNNEWRKGPEGLVQLRLHIELLDRWGCHEPLH